MHPITNLHLLVQRLRQDPLLNPTHAHKHSATACMQPLLMLLLCTATPNTLQRPRDVSNAGRSLSLLDPTYASKYIPIIASVSEHQPPAWNSYFTDVHILVLLAPLGLIACFRPMTDASLFLILYGVTAVYFSGVMVSSCKSLLTQQCDVLFLCVFCILLVVVLLWLESVFYSCQTCLLTRTWLPTYTTSQPPPRSG